MSNVLPIGASGNPRCRRPILASCLIGIEDIAPADIAAIVREAPVLHRPQHVIVRIASLIDRHAQLIISKWLEVLVLVAEKGLCVGAFTFGYGQRGLYRIG